MPKACLLGFPEEIILAINAYLPRAASRVCLALTCKSIAKITASELLPPIPARGIHIADLPGAFVRRFQHQGYCSLSDRSDYCRMSPCFHALECGVLPLFNRPCQRNLWRRIYAEFEGKPVATTWLLETLECLQTWMPANLQLCYGCVRYLPTDPEHWRWSPPRKEEWYCKPPVGQLRSVRFLSSKWLSRSPDESLTANLHLPHKIRPLFWRRIVWRWCNDPNWTPHTWLTAAGISAEDVCPTCYARWFSGNDRRYVELREVPLPIFFNLGGLGDTVTWWRFKSLLEKVHWLVVRGWDSNGQVATAAATISNGKKKDLLAQKFGLRPVWCALRRTREHGHALMIMQRWGLRLSAEEMESSERWELKRVD